MYVCDVCGGVHTLQGGSTPLQLAARGNHARVVKLLLAEPWAVAANTSANSRCDRISLCFDDELDQKEEVVLTPLAAALAFGSVDAALVLLQHGAQLNKIG